MEYWVYVITEKRRFNLGIVPQTLRKYFNVATTSEPPLDYEQLLDGTTRYTLESYFSKVRETSILKNWLIDCKGLQSLSGFKSDWYTNPVIVVLIGVATLAVTVTSLVAKKNTGLLLSAYDGVMFLTIVVAILAMIYASLHAKRKWLFELIEETIKRRIERISRDLKSNTNIQLPKRSLARVRIRSSEPRIYVVDYMVTEEYVTLCRISGAKVIDVKKPPTVYRGLEPSINCPPGNR